MSFSLDVLNKIRSTASQEYQDRIPEASRENISTIGQAFATYTPLFNEFKEALINRIGLTLIETASFENKLKGLKLGAITSGQDVQEIFVGMAKAEGVYDPEGKNPLGRRVHSDVNVVYHRQNRRDQYAISLGDLDFRRNFTSPETLDAFISAQLNSVYTGDEYDEWTIFKHLLATYSFTPVGGAKKSYFAYEVPELTGTNNAEACKTFVKTLKKAVQDMSFMSTEFNAAGVKTRSKSFKLFIHKDMLPEISVEVLMSAFNKEEAKLGVEIITFDDFDELTSDSAGKTYALLVDSDFSRIWDTLFTTETIRNPQGLFTNYFVHHHQILSLSPFKNAVRFVGKGGA